MTLARQIGEGPPELALRPDVKKPETSSGFWNWWWNTELNPRPYSDPDINAWPLSPSIRRFGQMLLGIEQVRKSRNFKRLLTKCQAYQLV